MPRSLITGITGQDGFFLAQLLASKDYELFGLVRDLRSPRCADLMRLAPRLELIEGDVRDAGSLVTALEMAQPDEVYNLAAESFVGASWKQADLVGETTAMGALRLLEAVRIHTDNEMGRVRCYQASSSEMFGRVEEHPQTEQTPLQPRTPYGVAKTFAHMMAGNYREHYGAFVCCGILYNHESEHRGPEFVPRKVSRGVARISLGLQTSIALGDLNARRDWGFAGDYVDAMFRMLQCDVADDYVIASGETHSIRELLDVAFRSVGIEDWTPYVVEDARFMRPAEHNVLVGDASKAADVLGWKPTLSFEDLIDRMVAHDVARERRTLAE